jgi:O-antigen ligase
MVKKMIKNSNLSVDRSVIGSIPINYKIFKFQIYIILASIIIFDEFDPITYWPSPIIYTSMVGGFRIVDYLLFFLLCGIFTPKIVMLDNGFRLRSPITISLFLFIFAIIIASIITFTSGSWHLFFAWKNLFLGALFFYSFINTFQTLLELKRLFLFIFIIIFIKTAYIFVAYIFGYGMYTTDKGYVPMLSYITFPVFANLLALNIIIFKKVVNTIIKIIIWTSFIITALVIVLSLSRIDWFIYLIGLLTIIVMSSFRKKLRFFLYVGFIVILVLVFLPSIEMQNVKMRYTQAVIGIINPQITTSPGQHLLDILDAIDIIKLNPILGIGAGGSYKTTRIREWKVVSYGVHNGFLNTWIKFGVLGVLAYLCMFFSFLKTGYHIYRTSSEKVKIIVSPAFGTGLGIWINSFLFAPSSFENFQKSILLFFCMAVVSIIPYIKWQDS